MIKKNGFTLIELLVAITIGILIVSLGSAALNEFNQKQKVETIKEELISNLRLARNYAVTNQLPTGGDRIAVWVDNNGLMIISPQNSSNVNVGNTLFSKNITSSGIGASTPVIRFSVSDGRSIGGLINFNVANEDLIKNIVIEESGLIYEKQ